MTKQTTKPAVVRNAKSSDADTLKLSGNMREIPLDESGKAVVSTEAPTFEVMLAKLNEQLADPNLFPLVQDALLKARQQIVQKRIHALNAEVKALRATLPKRIKHAKK